MSYGNEILNDFCGIVKEKGVLSAYKIGMKQGGVLGTMLSYLSPEG